MCNFIFAASPRHLCGQANELEAMRAKADELLYLAKQNGRNQVIEQM
jgi:PleD family two-component response regulator